MFLVLLLYKAMAHSPKLDEYPAMQSNGPLPQVSSCALNSVSVQKYVREQAKLHLDTRIPLTRQDSAAVQKVYTLVSQHYEFFMADKDGLIFFLGWTSICILGKLRRTMGNKGYAWSIFEKFRGISPPSFRMTSEDYSRCVRNVGACWQFVLDRITGMQRMSIRTFTNLKPWAMNGYFQTSTLCPALDPASKLGLLLLMEILSESLR